MLCSAQGICCCCLIIALYFTFLSNKMCKKIIVIDSPIVKSLCRKFRNIFYQQLPFFGWFTPMTSSFTLLIIPTYRQSHFPITVMTFKNNFSHITQMILTYVYIFNHYLP